MNQSAGNIFVTLSAVTNDFVRGMGIAHSRMTMMERQSKGLGTAISVGLAMAFGVAAKAASNMAADFESSLNKIVSLVGMSREQVDSWRGDILRLGGDTAKAPQELADALYYITSAGVRSTNTMSTLTAVAQASATGLGSVTDVARTVVSAMNAWAGSSLSAEQATSYLVATVREGNITAEEVARSFSTATPVASALGVGMGEIGAALAALTQVGTPAARAMTQINRLMLGIAGPSEGAEKAFRKMGLTSAELRATLAGPEGLYGALQKISEASKKQQDPFAALDKAVPNIRALVPLLSLIGENSGRVKEIWDSVNNAKANEAARAFDVAADSAQRLRDQLSAEFSETMIHFGQVVNDLAYGPIKGLTTGLDYLNRALEAIPAPVKNTAAVLIGLNLTMGLLVSAVDAMTALKIGGKFAEWGAAAWIYADDIKKVALSFDGLSVAIVGVGGAMLGVKIGLLVGELQTLNGTVNEVAQNFFERWGAIDGEFRKVAARKLYLGGKDEWKAATDQLIMIAEKTGHLDEAQELLGSTSLSTARAVLDLTEAWGLEAIEQHKANRASNDSVYMTELLAKEKARLAAESQDLHDKIVQEISVEQQSAKVKKGLQRIQESMVAVLRVHIKEGKSLLWIQQNLGRELVAYTQLGFDQVDLENEIAEAQKALIKVEEDRIKAQEDLINEGLEYGSVLTKNREEIRETQLHEAGLAALHKLMAERVEALNAKLRDPAWVEYANWMRNAADVGVRVGQSLDNIQIDALSNSLTGALRGEKDSFMNAFLDAGMNSAEAFLDGFAEVFGGSAGWGSLFKDLKTEIDARVLSGDMTEGQAKTIGKAVNVAAGLLAAYQSWDVKMTPVERGMMGAQIGSAAGPWGALIGGIAGFVHGLIDVDWPAIVGASWNQGDTASFLEGNLGQSMFDTIYGRDGFTGFDIFTGEIPEGDFNWKKLASAMNESVMTAHQGFLEVFKIFGDIELMLGATVWGFQLPTVSGDNWAMLVEEWITDTIPEAVFRQMEDGLRAGLEGVGFTPDKIEAIFAEAAGMTGQQLIDFMGEIAAGAVAINAAIEATDLNELRRVMDLSVLDAFGEGMQDVFDQIDLNQAQLLMSLSTADQAAAAKNIADLIMSARESEIQMLRQIQQIQDSINSAIASSIEQLRLVQMTDEEKQEYYAQQASDAFTSLSSDMDPAQVAEAFNDFAAGMQGFISQFSEEELNMNANAFINSYFGGNTLELMDIFAQMGITPEIGESFADFLIRAYDEFQAISDELIGEDRQEVEDYFTKLNEEALATAEALYALGDAAQYAALGLTPPEAGEPPPSTSEPPYGDEFPQEDKEPDIPGGKSLSMTDGISGKLLEIFEAASNIAWISSANLETLEANMEATKAMQAIGNQPSEIIVNVNPAAPNITVTGSVAPLISLIDGRISQALDGGSAWS